MAIGMSELKKGLKIEVEGIPYKIVEYQHVKPGKGAAFVRAKIKYLIIIYRFSKYQIEKCL